MPANNTEQPIAMKPNVIECKEQDLIDRCKERNVDIKLAMQSVVHKNGDKWYVNCLLYTSPSPRDG